jgi:hypothetical protein
MWPLEYHVLVKREQYREAHVGFEVQGAMASSLLDDNRVPEREGGTPDAAVSARRSVG